MNHSYKKFTFLTFLLLTFYLTSSFAQTERWIYTHNGSGNDADEAKVVVYGADGNIYAAGYSIYSTGAGIWDFTVISLGPVGVEEETTLRLLPSPLRLLEVYPNPFRSRIDIRFQIEDDRYKKVGQGFSLANSKPEGLPKICIYDASGRVVKNFNLKSEISNLQSEVSWNGVNNAGQKLPAGVYLLEFQVGDYKETR